MKRIVLVLLSILCLFSFKQEIEAQCSPITTFLPMPAISAPDAMPMCVMATLDGFMFQTSDIPNSATVPSVFCGTVENNHWYAFAAPQADLSINFAVSNCATPTNGGIQAEIYCTTDCTGNWTSVSNCWSPGMEQNGTVTATGLTPGDIYYMMIDGFAGDICNYTMTITNPPGGGGVGQLPAPTGIAGDDQVCFPSATFSTYLLPPGASCASSLLWSIQPPSAGSIVSDPTAQSILVQWNAPGFAQVCVQATNPCSVSQPGCFPVAINATPPGSENADICIGGTTICAGQVFNSPGVFPVTLTTAAGCDSLVNCIISPIPPIPPTNEVADYCAPNVHEVCGNFFSASGFYTTVCEAFNGCDSTVITDLAIMEAIAEVEDPEEIGCDPNNQQITLDGSNSFFSIAAGSTLEFEWTGPSFCGPTDDVFACVDQPGTYCFTITIARNGVECSDVFCVDVLANNETPPTPDNTGPDEVCDGSMETYTVSPLGTPLPTGYTWTTPNGEPFTITGNSITVDWTGSVGGDLCVTADNDCGPSDPPACISVVISLGPDDPIVSGDDVVCDGDVETYTIDNPDTTATYTWTVPTGASFTDNGTTIDVDFSGAMGGDICVEGDNDCGTSAQFCLTVVLTTVPDEPVFSSGADVLCDGTIETYCVNSVAGATSYTWTTPDGTFPGGDVCMDMDWTGLSDGQICVTADNDCGSSTEICLNVTVDEAPTAVISGDGAYCQGSGGTVDLTVDLTGTGPWILTYNDGVNANVIDTTSNNPYTLTVNTAGTYVLVDVDDATDCPGIVSGESIVTENAAPTASLSGSGAICEGSNDAVDLTIELTGANDWTVGWSIDGTAQAPLTITSSPYTLPITESQAGDIELTSVVDGNNCDGAVDGMVTVTINDAPTVSGISAPCDGTNTSFTVSFTINGGDMASYSVTPNTGTLVGNVFTSDPIASGLGYSFVVTDMNDCSPVTVSAMAVICDCDTEVGEMDQALIGECGEGPVTATYDDTNQNFDADDILVYILHEGSGLTIINPIDTNITEPTFSFLSSLMTYGTTYYISAVVGNNDGGGTVDLSDPCLAVAQGTPVVFREIPTGVLSGTTEICVGENAGLTVDFTGPGPWNIVYDDGSGQQTLTGITTNPFTLNLSPGATTSVTLDTISNVNCVGDASGSADITVNTPVEVSAISTTCNSTATGYVVTFQISGGDAASYVVTPAGSGTIDGTGLFTSNEITTPDGYNFTVDDINGCAPQIVTDDEVICDCTTSVGTMDATAIDECGDGPVTATYDAMLEVLDGDDVVSFILHEGSGQNIVNEIARNATEPTFSFMAPMAYGTTYYISAVVGNNDGSGSVNLGDPCISIAAGTPLTFFEVPTATLSGDPSICIGDCTNISVAFTGDAPYSITINNGTQDTTLNDINSNPFNYQVCPTSTTAYTLVGVNDENCPGDINGGANVTVNEAPVIVNSQVTINATNTGYTVSFEIVGGDPATYAVSPNNGTITGNTFTSNELPCGSPYNFSVDDDNGCGPNSVSDPMVDCGCISQAGDMDAAPLDVCGNGPVLATYTGGEQLDGNDALCFMLHNGDNSPISTNDDPSFNFSPLTMTYGVTYFICAVAGDDNGNGCVDFSDDCLSIGACTEVVYYEIPSASMSGTSEICSGEIVSIEVTFTGVGPWEFTYTPSTGAPVTTSDIMDNPYTFTVAPTVATTYQLTDVTDINCPGNASGVVAVSVFDAPFISPPTTICNSTNTGYIVTFGINGGDPTTYNVSPLTGTIDANGVFTSDEFPNGTGYQFFIDDGNGCGPVEAAEAFVMCDCETFAGALEQVNAIDECGEGPVTFTPSPVIPAVLDGDDVLNFMLHTGDNVPLMINDDGAFTFDDAILDYDATYLVCAVAGNNDGTGIVDITDLCLSISSCTEISFHEVPSATISGDQAICENVDAVMSVDFTGPGPWTIIYESTNGGQVTESGIVDNPYILNVPVSNSDVFTLVSMSNDFCPGTVGGSADVQVTNAPAFDLSTLTYDCDAVNFNYTVSVQIVGGDPSTYVMSGLSGTLTGNVFTSDPISGLTPFQFFVDDAFGCGPNELTDVSPIPTGTISGDNTICIGGTSTVTFNLSGEGPYDIQYLDENGNTQTINTPQTTVTINVTPNATSTITLVNVSNPSTGCGHSPNESVTIIVNQEANSGVAGEPFDICQGVPNVTDLNSLLVGADAGGQWQNSTGSVVSSMFNTEPQVPGVYEFTYVVAGMAPCPNAETTVSVEIFALPAVDVGAGGELTCDNVSVEIGAPSTAGLSYSWSFDSGPFPGDPTQAQVDINLPGTYTLTVTDDVTGCSNTDMITIDQNAETPSADVVTSDVRCFGESNGVITVQNVTGGSGPYMYSFNGGPFTDQTTYTNLGPNDYTIVVQDSKGCTQTLDFEILEPNELSVELIGDFEGDEGIVNLGDSLFLQLEVSVPFGALDVVNWFPPELLACDTCSSSWAYPTLQTTFSVSVENDGCVAEDDLTVFVKKNRPVYVPNVFAPGGDGHPDNELFKIFAGPQVARVKNFLVFNRWGETVFEVQDYDPKDSANLNIGWNGEFRGELMDAGVFVWFAEIEFIDGEVEIYEGDVTLLR